MKNFVCAIFMFVHFASDSLADAPKKTLYLQCGPHLVAIGTSLKQKILNTTRPESACASISHDSRTLWKDKKIGGPIIEKEFSHTAIKLFLKKRLIN